MSGNITGLVVISGIIKRRINIYFFPLFFLCDIFPARGGYSWVVTVDFFLCSLVRREGHHNRAFLEFCFAFLLPTSLLFTCFFLSIACFSFVRRRLLPFHSIF